jgi:hypothetical protein
MQVERRQSPRYELRLNGRILSPDMSFGAECTIRDLSETGALVSTPVPERLPSRVYLWQVQTGMLFECEVRWQKFDKLFGLRFIDICGRAQRRAVIERFAFERQPRRAANGNAPADTRPTALIGNRYATAH